MSYPQELTDPMREDIEKRMGTFPLGRGLIFPRIQREGDHYARKLVYPASFGEQARYAAKILD